MKNFVTGHIKELAPNVQETRTVEFIISTSAKDRHKTIVNMDGWQLDNFNRNPVVGYQHNVYGDNWCTPPNPDDVLGIGKAWTEEMDGRKVLMGSVQFETADINPLAEKVFRKVLNGTLRATSVGFMEIGKGEWKKVVDEKGVEVDRTYYFKGQELLEFSIVNIPANAEAVKRSLNHHTNAALSYITRLLPSCSPDEIRSMKVSEVMELVELTLTGQQLPPHNLEKIEREILQNKQRLVHYMSMRNAFNKSLIKQIEF